MKLFVGIGRVVAAVALFALFSTQAYAQATRTWVSGVGDDVNPCSRTAPCKTFAGAISKTAAGGTINALDPAGYGAVTITKSISIDGTGTNASILSSGTNGIIVNAAATDTVILRNLSIDGANTGINGIRILNAANVIVDNVAIARVTTRGIDAQPTGALTLTVTDVKIVNAATGGSALQPGAAGSIKAVIDRAEVTRGTVGIQANSRVTGIVRNSVVNATDTSGYFLQGGSGAVSVVFDNVSASNNNGVGLNVIGADATAFISRSLFSNNNQGLKVLGGKIETMGDNRNILNTVASSALQPVTPTQ